MFNKNTLLCTQWTLSEADLFHNDLCSSCNSFGYISIWSSKHSFPLKCCYVCLDPDEPLAVHRSQGRTLCCEVGGISKSHLKEISERCRRKTLSSLPRPPTAAPVFESVWTDTLHCSGIFTAVCAMMCLNKQSFKRLYFHKYVDMNNKHQNKRVVEECNIEITF